jgi:hypothetical protein
MMDIPTYAISFDLYYGGKSVSEMLEEEGMESLSEPEPVSDKTPRFRNISMSDITIKGALQAVMLQGLPEMNLENITLSDFMIEADYGISIADATDVRIENIQLTAKKGKAIQIFNSKNINVKALEYNFGSADDITIRGENSRQISIARKNKQPVKDFVFVGDEVEKETIVF